MKALLQLCLVHLTVAPLTANDVSFPDETHAGEANKNLIFGLQQLQKL